MRQRPLLLLLATFGLFGPEPRSGAAPAERAPISREYQIKAAFLYNFTKFVEWPPGRFPAPDSPIVIGLLGGNPFGNELLTIVRNRKVNGRAIEVRVVTTAAEAASVHVLFASAGQEAQAASMADALRRAGVLTVGESPAFAAAGGVVDFVLEGDKVRFKIDLAAGQRAGLKLSVQLLKLATEVRR
jgi:hypothetical protein